MAVFCSKLGILPGAIAPPLPYTFGSYLEANEGPYLITPYYPKNTTRIVCDYQFTRTNGDAQGLFTARGPASAYANRFNFWLYNTNVFRSDFGTSNEVFPSSISLTGRHVVDKNRNVCTIDGTNKVTNTNKTFTSAYPLAVFAGTTGGTIGQLANARIYTLQIYEADVLLYDYVPARRKDDNVLGLYDRISAGFLTNVGSGAFVMGEAA
jgi:hypothetical protein